MTRRTLIAFLEQKAFRFRVKTSERNLLGPRSARKINRVYLSGCAELERRTIRLISSIPANMSPFKKIAITFLAERIDHGSLHALMLHKNYPADSHGDIAAIVRGNFESAVNALFVLNSKEDGAAASFWRHGCVEERRFNDELRKWVKSDDEEIRRMATSEFLPEFPTIQELEAQMHEGWGLSFRQIPRWPRLQERAKSIGPIWSYLYDARYRALSTWHHGDLTRMFVSPSFRMLLPGEWDRNYYESTILASWTFDVYWFFARAFAKALSMSSEEDEIARLGPNVRRMAFSHYQDHAKRFSNREVFQRCQSSS